MGKIYLSDFCDTNIGFEEKIIVYNSNGKELFNGMLYKLPIRLEKTIVKKIEFDYNSKKTLITIE